MVSKEEKRDWQEIRKHFSFKRKIVWASDTFASITFLAHSYWGHYRTQNNSYDLNVSAWDEFRYTFMWPLILGLMGKTVVEIAFNRHFIGAVGSGLKVGYESIFGLEQDSGIIRRHASEIKDPLRKLWYETYADFCDNRTDRAFERIKYFLNDLEDTKIRVFLSERIVSFISRITYQIKAKIRGKLSYDNELGFMGDIITGNRWSAVRELQNIGKKGLDGKILEAYGRFCINLDSEEQWKKVLDEIGKTNPNGFRRIADSTFEVLEYPTSNFHDVVIFKRDKEGVRRGYEENVLLEEILTKYARDSGKDPGEFVNLTRSIACIEHNEQVYHINKRQQAESFDNYQRIGKDAVEMVLDRLARIHAASLSSRVTLGEEAVYIDGEGRMHVPRYSYRKEVERRFLDRFPEIDKEAVLLELEDIFRAAETSGISCLNHGDPYVPNFLDNGIVIDTRLCKRNPVMDVVGITEDIRVGGLKESEIGAIWGSRFKEYSGLEPRVENAHAYALLNGVYQIGSKFNQGNVDEAGYYFERTMELSKACSGARKHIEKCRSKIFADNA